MGLFRKRSTANAAAAADQPSEVETLRAELAAVTARLEAAEAEKQQVNQVLQDLGTRLAATEAATRSPAVKASDLDVLRAKVQRLADRLDAPLSAPAPPPPPPALEGAPAVTAADLTSIDERLTQLAGRLDQVDVRVTSIATELANQLSELSNYIEAAATSGSAGEYETLAEELRDAQARLANEQARYQIAFRQDLADLANRLSK